MAAASEGAFLKITPAYHHQLTRGFSPVDDAERTPSLRAGDVAWIHCSENGSAYDVGGAEGGHAPIMGTRTLWPLKTVSTIAGGAAESRAMRGAAAVSSASSSKGCNAELLHRVSQGHTGACPLLDFAYPAYPLPGSGLL